MAEEKKEDSVFRDRRIWFHARQEVRYHQYSNEGVFENVIPEIIAAQDNKVELFLAILLFSDRFNDGVKWILPKTLMEDIANSNVKWTDMPDDDFYGGTPTGQGLLAVINDCKHATNGETDLNAAAPAIILISDGDANTGIPATKRF